MSTQDHSWMYKTLKAIKDGIVTRTPDELAACESCGKLECSNGKWENCQHRKDTQESLKQERDSKE